MRHSIIGPLMAAVRYRRDRTDVRPTRAPRPSLVGLSEHMLRDIGLEPGDLSTPRRHPTRM